VNWKNIIFKLILISCAISILLVSCSNTADIEKTNKARAEIIIKALYEFKHDHNNFPFQLSALVPAYLDKIPTTLGDKVFFYSTDSVDGFNLGFDVTSHLGCGYTDKYKEWECSFGD